MRTIRTPKKRKALLEAIAVCGGNVARACKKVRISRSAVYEWCSASKAMARDFEVAAQKGLDAMEDEARRRAFDGVAKPVYQGGRKVGVVQEFSDTLAIFLLKGGKPDKYRDRAEIRHTGKLTMEQLVTEAGKVKKGE